MKIIQTIGKVIKYPKLMVQDHFPLLLKGLFLIVLFCAFGEIRAQDQFTDETEATGFIYDEIPAMVSVEGMNNFYMDVLYTSHDSLFINIEALFRTLKIPCVVEETGKKLSGFIEKEDRTYSIDFSTGQIKVGDKTIRSEKGLVYEMGTVYMESTLFAEVFGITLSFNYRSLTILLKSDFELPVIKLERIEKLRNNLLKIKGEELTDTVVKRNYHFFKPGMLDWSVGSFQAVNESTDNRFSFGLGAEFLFGEVNVAVTHYDQYKFDNRQLFYQWRWVDNDKKMIKQAQVGRISNQAISYLYAPVIGAVVRNSPTTVRKAKGYYTINDITEPNWTIELYLNDVLVDYTKSDASGQYLFKVPIVYGYTSLKLKFYGPMGEERTEERILNMPYTVMPGGEFEYTLSGGMVQDSIHSHFGRAEFNYGVNRFLTLGGGLEYLSSIPNKPFIPFVRATLQPFSKLTFNGEYAHGVKARGILDYFFWKSAMLEIDYAKYVKGQMATRFNALEERKLKLSLPFRYRKINGFTKLDYTQLVYQAFMYTNANAMVSGYYKQFSANSTLLFNWVNNQFPYVSSDLAFSCRLKKGYVIRPSAQYNVSESRFRTQKIAVEKSIPKGYFSVSYERNVMADENYFSLSFKYDLDFVRTNLYVALRNGSLAVSESAQGSLAFGSGNKQVHRSNNSSLGKGGISLYPFLDMNQNGIFDPGEHPVKLNKVKVSGGRPLFSKKDSIIRIPDLNAFVSYRLEFDDNELETISWRFRYKSYQVLVDPNQFKRIDIPVIPVGEVSGTTYREFNNSLKGIGRILVKIYLKNSARVVTEILSESDGYLYYLGLKPGDYVARVDSAQLSNLDIVADPAQIDFTVKTLEEGDIVGGIDFVLRPAPKEKLIRKDQLQEQETESQASTEKKEQDSENSLDLFEQSEKAPLILFRNPQTEAMPRISVQISLTTDSTTYVPGVILAKLQFLTSATPLNVSEYFKELLADVPGFTILETQDSDGMYHYTSEAFRDVSEVRELVGIFTASGWKNCAVIIYAGGNDKEKLIRIKRKTN